MATAKQLESELQTYEKLKDELVRHHNGKWVLIHDHQFVDTFDTFDNAAREAVKRFGRGPYLIRQVGRSTQIPMPASVAYRPIYATPR